MKKTSLFKIVIIINITFVLLAIIASQTLSSTLPIALQNYLFEVENTELSTFDMAAGLIFLIATIVSIIGLWLFKNWARTLYVSLLIISIPFYFSIGPAVMTPWEAIFNDITMLSEGILLTLMFSNEISERFSLTKKMG